MSSVKRLICLANSRKHGAYCFAGIDCESGQWLRPVSDLDDGRVERAVMLLEGRLPRLGELVDVPLAEGGPDFGFECENRTILPGRWILRGSLTPSELQGYCSREKLILHNGEGYVTVQYLQGLPFENRRTLQLVEAFGFEAFSDGLSSQGGHKWTATFVVTSGERLSVRITDPVLTERLEKGYRPAGHCLVTVSLSMPFRQQGWDRPEDPCWKLVAGVIEMAPGAWPRQAGRPPDVRCGTVEGIRRPDERIGEAAVGAMLRSVFGFERFRPNQAEIVRAILDGRDCFAVMPTGGGKSLCYQLPARLLAGTCLVISPLIALMKDQVDAAVAIGLRAACLSSGQSETQRLEVFRDMLAGKVELLYISPERLAMEIFLNNCKRLRLSLIAVDEAHCISEWGHDFRPDYLSLSELTKHFPRVPIAAFTATATPRVQGDIVERLGLRDPLMVRASFDRPNLFYEVLPKRNVETQIVDFVAAHPAQAGIVYRASRRAVDATVEKLVAAGIRAVPYHAGMEGAVRQASQEAFNRDEAEVVVATIAFGMGIDKPNVRYVLHGDLPKNMEAYYQETGRAGRDGEPARCVLFYGYGDVPRNRYFIDQIQDATERRRLLASLNEMVCFARNTTVCRRRKILGYFGEQYPREGCSGCDVCRGGSELIDATADAQVLLCAIYRTGQHFGAGHITDIVRGANKRKVRELGHDRLPTFGAGKGRDAPYWRGLLDDLLNRELILRSEGEYPVLRLTDEALAVIHGRQRVLLRPAAGPAPDLPVAPEPPVQQRGSDGELFERLRVLRRRLAKERNMPPFVIFSDRTLREMASARPTTVEALGRIHGVGEAKLAAYGRHFLTEIASDAAVATEPVSVAASLPPAAAAAKSPTVEATWALLEQGLDTAEIARRRGLDEKTIVGHVERLILTGRAVAIEALVPGPVRAQLEAIIPAARSSLLRELVQAASIPVSFEQARLMRAWLRVRQGEPATGRLSIPL